MKQIAFHRHGKNIIAKIIKTTIEPFDNTRQVVFFCEDSSGKRYRVPKNEVLIMGRESKKKKKARELA